ncbi:hypothetical protein BDF20DRAFT_825150 [Mycotypha africana]|uniref:uncharacterized protein n=1 Tax=Mycotypha africana TaxID=64632 RepID=UPI0023001906|nr:uncharacterized protein BDF20DRAFT_825150 [Mycotypha africana]KAI8971709.1 hypothetical protein BDF20DRAFT_825150 [Mycotypha africana]
MIDAECTKINSLDEEKDAVRHIDLSISEWLARNVPSDHYTLLQDLLEKDDNVFYKMFTYEAQKALKRLASNNRHGDYESEAQFLLANCYGTGALGVPISTEKAFTLYLLASKQSHLEAIYRAGVCYELGLGTKKSYRHAVNFYRKAASRTHISSMYKLAIIYLRGFCAQPVDIKEAFVWLQRSAYVAKKSIQEHPEVLYVFALSQLPNKEFNKMNAVTDVPYALELLEMTAKMGYLPSQLKLGELYELGSSDNTFPVVEVNDVLSIYWYTQAAQLGSADAALALSCWYLTGSQKVLQQSDRNAYLWARKAAASQQAERWTIAKANYAVGTYIKEGIGVHNEKVEDSFTWFKRSAALGHLNAIHMVENCHK